jgi:transcriptional regulator with XRE-family HTH domain
MKRYPKGTWMKLKSAEILLAFMRQKDFSMARLARYAGCSKSFIGFLCNGDKTSCTPELADRIAEALDVPRAALFDERTSTARSDSVDREPLSA